MENDQQTRPFFSTSASIKASDQNLWTGGIEDGLLSWLFRYTSLKIVDNP
jgi:hypothetical protein